MPSSSPVPKVLLPHFHLSQNICEVPASSKKRLLIISSSLCFAQKLPCGVTAEVGRAGAAAEQFPARNGRMSTCTLRLVHPAGITGLYVDGLHLSRHVGMQIVNSVGLFWKRAKPRPTAKYPNLSVLYFFRASSAIYSTHTSYSRSL